MDFISDDFYTYDQFAVKANTHIYNTCNEPRHAILFSQGKLEKSYRIFLSGFFTNNLFFEDVKINKT